jgi:uncharacterized damage-inducible protein DinB
MHTADALLDMHERTQRGLEKLIAHCRSLTPEELDRELEGFACANVRLQLHHELSAQRYWIGVLEGRIDVQEDEDDYPTAERLETLRREIFELTTRYLRAATTEELNTPRRMMTWGDIERELVPAHVVLRTLTHTFHHQGQITAMCRLLGKPIGGLDYPLDE